jgi:hypothetical protein
MKEIRLMKGHGTGPVEDVRVTFSEYNESDHDPQADAQAILTMIRNLPADTLVALVVMKEHFFNDAIRHGTPGFKRGEPMG